jgi:hypothetical protein
MEGKGFMIDEALKVKVISCGGQTNHRYIQDGNLEIVAVIECISADGTVIPPKYIFKGGMHILG